jgi:hypothetical protein
MNPQLGSESHYKNLPRSLYEPHITGQRLVARCGATHSRVKTPQMQGKDYTYIGFYMCEFNLFTHRVALLLQTD